MVVRHKSRLGKYLQPGDNSRAIPLGERQPPFSGILQKLVSVLWNDDRGKWVKKTDMGLQMYIKNKKTKSDHTHETTQNQMIK